MAATEGLTVLVIDDDEDLVELVVLVLEEAGYAVETAADGREGLEAVARRLPDLILLDMKMPVMDGWQFARAFHAEHDDATPILVFTAAEDAAKRAQEVGAAGWIGKPFSLDELVAVVRRHLGAG